MEGKWKIIPPCLSKASPVTPLGSVPQDQVGSTFLRTNKCEALILKYKGRSSKTVINFMNITFCDSKIFNVSIHRFLLNLVQPVLGFHLNYFFRLLCFGFGPIPRCVQCLLFQPCSGITPSMAQETIMWC